MIYSINTYTQDGVVLWLVVYVGIPILTLYFYLLLKDRLEREVPADWPGHASWDSADRDAELAFLRTYRSALGMPDGLAESLVFKARDQIEASRNALIAESMASGAATAEAISRMGPPLDLARQARRSNQTWVRFLGGIAAGILAMPGAGILGSVVGLLTGFVIHVIGPAVFSVSDQSHNSFARGQLDVVVGMALLSVGAFYASRTGARVWAGVSGRRPAPLGVVWAIVGTPIVAAAMLFLVRGDQSWPIFIAEMLVPVAYAAGALVFVDRSWWLEPIRSRAFVALIGASVVIGLVSSLMLVSAYRSNYVNIDPYSPGFPTQEAIQAIQAVDTAGPYPSASDHFKDSFASYPQILSGAWPVAVYVYFYGPNMKDPLPGWTDIRIEAWRSTSLGGIAAGTSAPAATAPVFPVVTHPEADNEVLTGRLDLGLRRDGPFWWILITGVAPDGVRYRLVDDREALGLGLLNSRQFATLIPYGTAWEWLTAPG